jgi:hypothetical protein
LHSSFIKRFHQDFTFLIFADRFIIMGDTSQWYIWDNLGLSPHSTASLKLSLSYGPFAFQDASSAGHSSLICSCSLAGPCSFFLYFVFYLKGRCMDWTAQEVKLHSTLYKRIRAEDPISPIWIPLEFTSRLSTVVTPTTNEGKRGSRQQTWFQMTAI